MAVIYAFGKLNTGAADRLPFEARVDLLMQHYALADRDDVGVATSYDPEAGVCAFAAWRKFEHQAFNHFNEGVLISHYPFGYSELIGEPHPAKIHHRLATALRLQHRRSVARLHPPFALLDLRRPHQLEFWNDALGLGKTFRLDAEDGVFFASRPIACHLLAGAQPAPDPIGWAAEHAFGWFIGETSPYANMKRMHGGAYISVGRRGLKVARRDVVFDWFVKAPRQSPYAAFNRLKRELKTLANDNGADIALSGGRDSRASASIFADGAAFPITFRTNFPPELERILAADLIERHPRFARFGKDSSRAYDPDGAVLWRTASPTDAKQPLVERATGWTALLEGIAPSVSLYSDCKLTSPLPPWPANNLTVSGAAGESAKAYYWSPHMVSGVFVRSMKNFLEEIKTPVEERIKSHPLTAPKAMGVVDQALIDPLLEYMHGERARAEAAGVKGYGFFDFWWLTSRFAAGTNVGYHLSNAIMPFLVPEFTATGMQQPVVERVNAKLTSDIVAHYMPTWAEVPYFDQAQNTAPKEQLRYYRRNNILFEGDNRAFFFDLLENSTELVGQLDMAAVREAFDGDTEPAQKGALNMRAFGIMHRHYFALFCREVGEKITAKRRAG